MEACPTLEEILAQVAEGTVLGEGAYGKVYKIGDFVLKTMKLTNERKRQLFAKEKEVIQFLSTKESLQPYLPKLCWVRDTDEKGYILQRYEPVVPLDVFLKSMKDDGRKWNVAIGGTYVLNLIKAFEKLHRLGILHRDIKPGNLLVRTSSLDAQKVPILIDFGLSCAGGHCMDYEVGSVGYFALNFLPKSYRGPLQRTFTLRRSGEANRLATGKTRNRPVRIFSSKLTDRYALAVTIQEVLDMLAWPDTPEAKVMKASLENKYVLPVKGKLVGELAARTAAAAALTTAAQRNTQRQTIKRAAVEAAEEARLQKFSRLLKKYVSNPRSQTTRKRRATL
jgi:serine/threonine protein kinase